MNDQPSNTGTVLRLALWCGVAMLVAVGIAAAIGRAISVANAELAYDILQMLPATWFQDVDAFNRWFAAYPALTFLHIVPGSLFLALAPFQFSSRVRTRHIRFHRWSGRVAVLAALTVGLSGLLLGVLFPFGGPAASSAVFLFGAFFLVALVRAFIAIRRHDVVQHREWMIRLFSIGLGIATIRVVGPVLFAITRARPFELLGLSFWAGFVLNFAAAELWIRHTRRAWGRPSSRNYQSHWSLRRALAPPDESFEQSGPAAPL